MHKFNYKIMNRPILLFSSWKKNIWRCGRRFVQCNILQVKCFKDWNKINITVCFVCVSGDRGMGGYCVTDEFCIGNSVDVFPYILQKVQTYEVVSWRCCSRETNRLIEIDMPYLRLLQTYTISHLIKNVFKNQIRWVGAI